YNLLLISPLLSLSLSPPSLSLPRLSLSLPCLSLSLPLFSLTPSLPVSLSLPISVSLSVPLSRRGKDIPVKAGRGVKKTPPSTSPTNPEEEEEEPNSGAVTQQLNGSPAVPSIGQPLDLPPLAHPTLCALASRDNQSEEATCCLDDCTSDGTLTKEA
uniref:Uncharacterized protein n=1 Tax=Hucho hucho TaxID=62062 RepID=A0A4W5KLX3_9TELE